MVADNAARIEPKDEYLVIMTVRNQTIKQETASIGLIAKMTPKDVATPFPPLNLKNIVKICPIIAVIPTTSTNNAGKFIFMAMNVGKNPFRVSMSSTIIP